MSERLLEVALLPDGRFLASSDDGRPAVEVSSWDEVRRLRAKLHLVDHWTEGDRQAFIKRHGHPFDDWWEQLTGACADALMADPNGPVPAQHLNEVKRTLRHQPPQEGLGLDGSRFTADVQDFIAEKSRGITPRTREGAAPAAGRKPSRGVRTLPQSGESGRQF
jgi:hypothetical protein